MDKTDPAITILNQKLPKDELVIADNSTAGDIWRMCNENPEVGLIRFIYKVNYLNKGFSFTYIVPNL